MFNTMRFGIAAGLLGLILLAFVFLRSVQPSFVIDQDGKQSGWVHFAITSEPAEAVVSIDGLFAGVTPLQIQLRPGARQIDIEKERYQLASTQLLVVEKSKPNRKLHVRLRRALGQVRVESSTKGAQLFVDGELKGMAGDFLLLPATTHVIEVRKPGFMAYRTLVTPDPDMPLQLLAKLHTIEEAAAHASPEQIVSPAGQVMRLLRPWSYTMGSATGDSEASGETPNFVDLRIPFYMSLHEVSNAQYRRFAPQHHSGSYKGHDLNQDDQPVVRVSWNSAARYCNWLSKQAGLRPYYIERQGIITGFAPRGTGYRLPTELEWEWAARAVQQGSPLKHFPWRGKTLGEGAETIGNYADTAAQGLLPKIIAGYRDGFAVSAPVGSFPPNAWGLHDMDGNVLEWTAPMKPGDPVFKGQAAHVIRGGSWRSAEFNALRLTTRRHARKQSPIVGFRLARKAASDLKK